MKYAILMYKCAKNSNGNTSKSFRNEYVFNF